MKIIMVVLGTLTTLACGGAQQSSWMIQRNPNFLDAVAAHSDHCSVYIQNDGGIRLNVFDPNFPGTKDFDGGMYENIILAPAGEKMKVVSDLMSPAHLIDPASFDPERNWRTPGLFWVQCGNAVSALPKDIRRAFRSYNEYTAAKN